MVLHVLKLALNVLEWAVLRAPTMGLERLEVLARIPDLASDFRGIVASFMGAAVQRRVTLPLRLDPAKVAGWRTLTVAPLPARLPCLRTPPCPLQISLLAPSP